jgi:hypothetical protein
VSTCDRCWFKEEEEENERLGLEHVDYGVCDDTHR